MNSKVCHTIKTRQKPNDNIYTPIDVAIDCINYTKPFLLKEDVILEPFAGENAFYNNFPIDNKKLWCEIDRDKDFLDFQGSVDWIITNPPWGIFNKIIDKIISVSKKGFCLLVNNLTITPNRLDNINNQGFYISRIYYFKIHSWFGYQYYYIFEKRKDKKNLLELIFKKKHYF